MGKEHYIIKMEIKNTKEIGLMINLKEMENIFFTMILIILENLKMVQRVEKEYIFIKMEI